MRCNIINFVNESIFIERAKLNTGTPLCTDFIIKKEQQLNNIRNNIHNLANMSTLSWEMKNKRDTDTVNSIR